MTKDYIYCTQCGTKNTTDSKFCTECGSNLHQRIAANERLEEQVTASEQNIIEEQDEKISKDGTSKKLIGILSIVLIAVATIFIYIQRSDSLSNPFASLNPFAPKEEIWVTKEEDDEYLSSTLAVKIIDNEEAWLMEGYQVDSFDAGISNIIYDLEKMTSGSDDAITLKSTNLKKIEMFRLPPSLWVSDEIYYVGFDLEIFGIDSDHLDSEESYWNQVIEQYLDIETFEKIVSRYDSINEYIDKEAGTMEEKRSNLSIILSEYTEENADEESSKELIALRKELTEAVIEKNNEFIEKRIEAIQLEIEEEMQGESIMSEEEIATLQDEMRAQGLEYDDFHIEPQIYLDEENLNLVVGIANLSKSAQFVFQEGDDFIFEKLPAGHPENDYDEEILIVYHASDQDDKEILFKEDE